jgi:hypothetical protein
VIKRIVMAGLVSGTLAATVTPAVAKIEPVDIACTNPGGNEAGGQQPTCKTDAHEQESENQNPAGHAPAGHN